MKKLSAEQRVACAREYGIPLAEEAIANAEFYRPPEDSAEHRYLTAQRAALGGYLPQRAVQCPQLATPDIALFRELLDGSGGRAASSTMAMVRLLAHLLKDADIGRYIVPIVPDEARTFGMDSLFRVAGIYSPEGQNYRPVDADSLLPYREARDGQILQEGICETGAIASFLAAGTAYAVHGIPTIPFYIFYSMFGFQRVGDMIWTCADMLCRGFLLGGTAGRTTLNGEGLQHADGHSHVVAETVPNLESYDPAFGFELAVIVRDGIRRMYVEQENVFYYITLYNEPYPMPALPAEDSSEGILRGLYLYRPRTQAAGPCANLLAAGPLVRAAEAAAEKLEAQGIAAQVFSVTSFNKLYRDAVACAREGRLNPLEPRRISHIEHVLGQHEGVFVAVSDYMKSLAYKLAQWIPGEFTVLGTDGFGRSATRPELRDYFEVSADHLVLAALETLARTGEIEQNRVTEWLTQSGIDAHKPNPSRL